MCLPVDTSRMVHRSCGPLSSPEEASLELIAASHCKVSGIQSTKTDRRTGEGEGEKEIKAGPPHHSAMGSSPVL